MSTDQFHESLAGLLPQGYAWPRDPDSVLMRVVASEAAELDEHTEAVHAMVNQWQPHATVARLAEWEAACGLPDECLGTAQTEAQRRVSLLRTLRGPALPLNDSSPAAPAVIEAACAEVGFTVTVRYSTPFRVGRNRVGQRLGTLDGRLYVTVSGAAEPFRVGRNRVGDRLVKRDIVQADLLCYLERLVPARFSINVIFE
jgi:uncharacterized protein YmfQ (DUF2313 family)